MKEGGRTPAKLQKLQKEQMEIEENVTYCLISLKILFHLDVLEVILTNDYSPQFLHSRDQYNTKKLSEIGYVFKKIENTFLREHRMIKDAAIISEDKVKRVGRDIRKMAKRNKDFYKQLHEGFKHTMDQMIGFNEREREFIVEDEELYMIED